MKLFDLFRFRKKKNPESEAAQASADPAVTPIEFDPSEIQIPESRFTEEYRAFLEAQENEPRQEDDKVFFQSDTETD